MITTDQRKDKNNDVLATPPWFLTPLARLRHYHLHKLSRNHECVQLDRKLTVLSRSIQESGLQMILNVTLF